MKDPLPINRISPPSIEDFYRNYVKPGEPVIITGMTADWPAAKLWDLNYFERTFKDLKVWAMHLKNGEYDVYKNRGGPDNNIRLTEVIESVSQENLNGLSMVSLVNAFPEVLKNDYKVPIYCRDGKFQLSRLFIGPASAITPLHQDYPENIYVVVKGKKRIMLFRPGSPVYAPRFSKMPTHSPVDPENPDYKKYPKLARLQPYIVELSAGETLYIPSMWWHHFKNLETSIAMNFWWSRRWMIPVAWAASVYNKYLVN